MNWYYEEGFFMRLIRSIFVIAAIVAICLPAVAKGPTPFSPSNEARLWTGDAVPIFTWSYEFGNYGYYLEFDDYNDWNPPLGGFFVDSNSFDLSEYITQQDWDPLVFNIYWRVRTVLFGGNLTSPGPTFHFSKTTAEPPEPWQPLNGQILRPWSQPVTFTWDPYPNGEIYYLQFASDIEFRTPLGEITWNQPYLSMLNFISPQDWHYLGFSLFWRVSAGDHWGNISPWGSASGFIKLGYRRVMCLGDSITGGYGSSTFDDGFGGYPPLLAEKLVNWDEESSVTAYWFSGGKAEDGSMQIFDALATTFSGAMIVMFGTVDIIDPSNCENGDCRTLERLQEIVEVCREYAIAPIICTVIPYNPDGGHPKYPDPSVIQSELDQLNTDIRQWCASENVCMADLDQIMRDNAPDGDLGQLYFDWAHPNDLGYQIIADGLRPVVTSRW